MHPDRRTEAAVRATARGGSGEIITIVSGKGGVGKTNLAVNLGICLARHRRAILLDADFGLANADILLNTTPRADFADLLDGRRAPDDLLVDGPAGLRVLCGVSRLGRHGGQPGPDPRLCRSAIEPLRAACDVLLVDCAAGLSELTLQLALIADRLIVVTTPEPTALTDGYATLKALTQRGFIGRPGVVVNMAHSRREALDVARRMGGAVRRFLGRSLENLGYVSLDRHVPAAVRARAPVIMRHPHCPASLCIERISEILADRARSSVSRPGLWSRVAGLFL